MDGPKEKSRAPQEKIRNISKRSARRWTIAPLATAEQADMVQKDSAMVQNDSLGGKAMVAAEAEAKRVQIEAALAEAIDSQKKEAEGIVINSSSWVISGKNPG